MPTFGSVTYKQAYPKIDIKFDDNNRHLAYDIIVGAGADPSKLKFLYNGMQTLEVTQDGDLVIHMKNGDELIQKKPLIYR